MTAYLRDVASKQDESRDMIRNIFGTEHIDNLFRFNVNGNQVDTDYTD